MLLLALACLAGNANAGETGINGNIRQCEWIASAPIFQPGAAAGAFDEVAVKDPSLFFFEGRWHLFYTTRSKKRYRIGYAAAETLEGLADATRCPLVQLRGEHSEYAAAPQVFFFAPQQLWYLIFQTRDANYQPVFSTTETIAVPESWSKPEPLVKKEGAAKWIDFWTLCDNDRAYLYYTRDHRDVCVMDTALEAFPKGFSNPRVVFTPVHEAVHVYKVRGGSQYHMVCEYQDAKDMRHFGLAVASHPLGPWTLAKERYAAAEGLLFSDATPRWTAEVSHGEAIRSGYDQRLEYDPAHTRLIIQGLPSGAHAGPYELLPWSLGLITLRNGRQCIESNRSTPRGRSFPPRLPENNVCLTPRSGCQS